MFTIASITHFVHMHLMLAPLKVPTFANPLQHCLGNVETDADNMLFRIVYDCLMTLQAGVAPVPTTAWSATAATADACDKENTAADTSVSSECNNSMSSSSAVKTNKFGDHNAAASVSSSSGNGCNTSFSGGLSLGSINSKLVRAAYIY
jgi:hypothetical protein